MNTLLDKCLEIEGLISLRQQRADMAPARLQDLLEEKTRQLLTDILALRDTDEPESYETQTAEPQPIEPQSVEVQPEESQPENLQPCEPQPAECQLDNADEQLADAVIFEETADADPAMKIRNEVVTPPSLSLNDQFRFRRELFHFSEEEMDEAMNVAAQMSSVEEIEDYFYNDLCLDASDETVRDFMKIVTARFD